MAWCALWFMTCYYPCKVPATAPTAHQLEDVLWAEIAKWLRVYQERTADIGKQFEWSGDALRLKAHPMESFAVARTARPEKPEALQGFHSDHVLFLIDEASGIADVVFEVAEGALSTDGAYVVMAANPTRQSGYFYDSHHKMREQWATLHVDAETCARVSRSYIEGMAKKYGVDSPIYKVRVKGEFSNAIDGVIPLEWCAAAVSRDVAVVDGAKTVWGLDVARFGDDSTAIAKRKGNHQLEPTREWYGKDTMQTVGLIKAEWDETPAKQRPSSINVDVIGIGAGVVDRLREQGLPVYGVNVAESSSTKDKYNRLRDELWFEGREWLQRRDCRLCDDDGLIGELTTPRYTVMSNGKIVVERKDELKKRGVASPNRADAWLLTFANEGVSNWNQPLKYPKLGGV